MNHIDEIRKNATAVSTSPGRRENVSFGSLFLLIFRNLVPIITSILSFVVIGAVYYFLATPTYRAQAQLLLDPKLPQVFREANDLGMTIDTGQIETHMVALKSRSIAENVVRNLTLWKYPEFQASRSLAFGWISDMGQSNATSAEDPQRNAIDQYLRKLSVEREGISQVINIKFTSQDRSLAAEVVNETTRAYIQNIVDVRGDAARAASEWLEERLQQLRLQMNAAAKRTQNFRANAESATLEELQLSAETYRKVYQDFYSAFTEAVQRESYPVSTIRVISEATPPSRQTFPNLWQTIGIAIVAGGALGLLVAILRESARLRRNNLRSETVLDVREGV